MIKANSIQEAWDIVNQIFPTDYEKDESSSRIAGYPIYRSTTDGRYYDYICDLNDRLEINLTDGNKSINVWIEASTEQNNKQDDIKKGMEAMYAAKELGTKINPIMNMETYTKIILGVDGDKWNSDETEVKVYNGLKRDETWLASDLVASYCDNHGIKWGVIEGLDICHYEHGNKGEGGGHFIIKAYIKEQLQG